MRLGGPGYGASRFVPWSESATLMRGDCRSLVDVKIHRSVGAQVDHKGEVMMRASVRLYLNSKTRLIAAI